MASKTKLTTHTNGAEVVENDAPTDSAPKPFDVSDGTLQRLTEGRDTLLQQRQQVLAKLQEIDTAIQRQEGGIVLMQTLLGRSG